MEREQMHYGMAVKVTLPNPSRSSRVPVPEERDVEAVVIRPYTSGSAPDCTDVRLANGEERMVHASRISPRQDGAK